MKRIVSLLLVLCCLGTNIVFAADDRYEEAKALFNEGKYEEAQVLFEELGVYEDSAEMSKECKYQLALEYMGDRKWYRPEILYAIPLLEELENYKDSTELLKEAYYKTASSMLPSAKSFSVCEYLIDLFQKSGDYAQDTNDVLSSLRARQLWCYIEENSKNEEVDYNGISRKYITVYLKRDIKEKGDSEYLNIYAADEGILWFVFMNKSEKADQEPMYTDWYKYMLRIVVYPYSEDADVVCWYRLQTLYRDTGKASSISVQGTGSVNINSARSSSDINIETSLREILSVNGNYTKSNELKDSLPLLEVPLKMYRDIIDHLDLALTTLPFEVSLYDIGFCKDWERTAQRLKELTNKSVFGLGGTHILALREDHTVLAGGYNDDGRCDVDEWNDIIAVDAGYENAFSVGLKSNGTVIATGNNDYGQCNTNTLEWANIKSIEAKNGRTVGLRKDGTVIATGYNKYGQCDLSDWKDIVAISAGQYHTVGLRSNGFVVSAGDNTYKQGEVSDWNNIVKIAAGKYNTVGLTRNGTVIVAGNNDYGQCETSSWKDIIDISIGNTFVVGLKSDGTVVATGSNNYNQCDVSEWHNIVSICSGAFHTVGLCSDGTVIAIGYNEDSRCDVSEWSDIVSICADDYQTVGVHSNGTICVVGGEKSSQREVSDWTNIMIPETYTLLDIIG